ncbi:MULTISPECIES: helix-turn-helix transcriptional regulator [Hungatella]|uniref:helix-turn-helix transcriptional regulator n=1 Tax=Hungatella TaxID=1649459 RepID=UPI002A81D54D|nr:MULTISPECIES: helix-turn-helix transcriptional regulator [Hungatella]
MTTTMSERIKQIRKGKDISQEEFGNKIGITRSSVSLLESGRNNPSEQTIKLICQEFSVNELWLRTGQGNPDEKLEGEERYALNIGKLQNTDNETVMRWVNAIAETNPELLEDIEKFFMTLLGIKKEPD